MKAIWHYTYAIQYYPISAILLANRAMCFIKMKQWAQAIIDCSLAISFDQTYLKAYWRRGIAAKNLGDHAMAENDFKFVLEHEKV